MGAPDPRPKVEGGGAEQPEFDLEARKGWWSLQALQEVEPPAPGDGAWSRGPIDQLILAGLEAEGMSPAGPATRTSWIRRVTFDLTGLPPEPEHVAEFLTDNSQEAFEKVVDRLLASPRFGEHWRGTGSISSATRRPRPSRPTTRCRTSTAIGTSSSAHSTTTSPTSSSCIESIAGDLIDEPRTDPDTGINESVIGPGLFYLTDGQHGPPDIRADQARIFDGMIDTLGKAFLAQTIACARCHDHKFDAITTADYYSLYGVLAGLPARPCQHQSPGATRSAPPGIVAPERPRAGRAGSRCSHAIWRGERGRRRRSRGGGSRGAGSGGLGHGESALAFPGRSFGGAARPLGDFIPSSEGEEVLRTMAGGRLAAGTLSSRFGGSIKSPDFLLDGSPVRVRIKGKNARVSHCMCSNYELVGHGPTTNRLTMVVNSDEWAVGAVRDRISGLARPPTSKSGRTGESSDSSVAGSTNQHMSMAPMRPSRRP